MIIITYTLSLLLLIYGLFAFKSEKRQQLESRVNAVLHVNKETMSQDEEKQSFSNRIIQPVWKRLKKNYQKNVSEEQIAAIELKLLQAGSPFGLTPVEYRFIQLALFLLLPGLVVVWALFGRLNTGVFLLFLLGSIVIARYLPMILIKKKIAERNNQALKELPDFLDLVTVSIEAGLGFDSALSKVVAKKEGVLSNEFQRCLEEMRLGKTRREALNGVRNRLVLDDVRALIGSIIQAEQLGIGMVQIMRVQSSEIRERRKQRAEEAAMKAPIKMLFPLILFIFPCIFIVLLGPAVIRFLGAF
ncbi:type II secretion system F family protein [Aquibacillus albus]|uniref:Tight adherence protein C n=1 Tax=Aquibacillus albus TaxID=1168171 RepID=A0ABS2N388_9BACI|nr:type II secretion system F family protein [Aquibacillus albus]MBM7572605.1 tight adherence protein C [Aquibacillus albus]